MFDPRGYTRRIYDGSVGGGGGGVTGQEVASYYEPIKICEPIKNIWHQNLNTHLFNQIASSNARLCIISQ